LGTTTGTRVFVAKGLIPNYLDAERGHFQIAFLRYRISSLDSIVGRIKRSPCAKACSRTAIFFDKTTNMQGNAPSPFGVPVAK
jgi:hypothetical protein